MLKGKQYKHISALDTAIHIVDVLSDDKYRLVLNTFLFNFKNGMVYDYPIVQIDKTDLDKWELLNE